MHRILIAIATFGFGLGIALAEGIPPTAPADTTIEMLPDIEAKTYSAPALRLSRSKKVVLLSDPSNSQPKVGKILLLKKDTENVAGLRVLKAYPGENKFAAKIVRPYPSYVFDSTEQNYKIIEKIADIGHPAPTLSPQDQSDLEELEAPPGTETEPAIEPEPAVDAEEEQAIADDELKNLMIEDVADLDPHNALIAGEFGFFGAAGPSGVTRMYAGGGLRLGVVMSQPIFFRSKNVQDSLTPEFGAYFFKVINYLEVGDAFDVFVSTFTGRYSLHFGHGFGIFAFGGLTKNTVMAFANSTNAGAINNLSLFYPAVGLGFFFNIGPHWEARVDAGLSRLTFGIQMRF